MTYFLDTNVCVALMRRDDRRMAKRCDDALYDGHELTISTIVLFELEYGIRKSSHVKANEERMGAFLKMEIGSLDVSYEDVAAAAVIRANLERLKQPIGPYDTLIAGQAIARNLTLVTANVREFSRVPGLKWIDWSE